MKKLLLLPLSLITTSAFAEYKVTLDIERPEKAPITVTEEVSLNKLTDFSSVKGIEYVSAVETTTKWYHTLFGIEPTPVETYAEIEVGVKGSFEVTAASEDSKLLFAIDGQIEELLSMDTTEYDIVSFPRSRSSRVTSTHVVELKDGKGCLKPFSATEEYSFSVCVETL